MKRGWLAKTIVNTVYYLCFSAAAFLLFKKALMICYVPTGSMENTIRRKSFVIGTRWDRKNISRYDVAAFSMDGRVYIKRVMGLPGETVEIRDGAVFADGEKLDDSFVREPMDPSFSGVYTVPKDSYFMLGDNRNNSYDSRYWKNKYVSKDQIIGKIRFPGQSFRKDRREK